MSLVSRNLNWMREGFQGELAQLHEQLAGLAARATEEMKLATEALSRMDVTLAEQVVSAHEATSADREACEEHARSLLALQAPVAADLRTIFSTLGGAVKIDRMGDLAVHIAEIVRYSYPQSPIPLDLRDTFATLGELTVSMAEDLYGLIIGDAVNGFATLNADDDAVDAICARLLKTVTDDDWAHGVQAATNVALLIRFYERFADQAVSVAKRLEFAATGSTPAG